MKDSTAYLVTNVLEYAAHFGFSGGTSSYRGTVAAKTGTSNFDDATLKAKGLPANAVNDLWTVAYTPQYSIALWYGYDEISSEYYSTLGTPKDNLMSAIMKHIPVTTEPFTQPSSVILTSVEEGSWPAQKPSQYTPEALVKKEYFISGTEPTDTSSRFAKLNNVTNLKATTTGRTVKLTWEHKNPEVLDEAYLNKYFSQSVFGNSSSKFLQERLSYNNDTLGGVGYGIYLKAEDGSLKLIDFTTEKSYTYKGESGTIVVKTEYRNFKNNASDGESVKVEIKGNSNDNDNNSNTQTGLSIMIKDGNEATYTLNNYFETGISVLYDTVVITDDCEISYIFDKKKYKATEELEKVINAITTPGKISITYEIKYKPDDEVMTTTAKKTITLK